LILLILQGVERFPHQTRQAVLSLILLTGAVNLVVTFECGDYHRDDWRGATDYIARRYQPGDGVMVERANIQKAFLYYYERREDRPPLTLVQLAATPDTADFEQLVERVWVIYRNPNENVHCQGAMPRFDPFEPDRSQLGNWLIARQGRVATRREFHGVTVILLSRE
jgi:hypothetical protein